MDNIQNIDFIKELGLADLSAEAQGEILLKIGRIIHQNIILRVLNELSDSDKDEFEKLLENKSDNNEEIMNFLRSRISNFDLIVKEEIDKFKKESIDLMQKIK